jgi:hypothetical protein
MRFERSLRDNTRTARDTATRYRASAARKSTSIATSSWTLMRRPIADLFSKPGRQLCRYPWRGTWYSRHSNWCGDFTGLLPPSRIWARLSKKHHAGFQNQTSTLTLVNIRHIGYKRDLRDMTCVHTDALVANAREHRAQRMHTRLA